jgi:Fe-S-cluster containining protein
MLLSTEDVERLERKGYPRGFFVRFDRVGYAKLRNQQGHCVFYDVEKRKCKVHGDRPAGCRLYPVIYDEAKGIVVDTICHAQTTVSEKQKVKRGKKVLKLLGKIDAETKKRRSA